MVRELLQPGGDSWAPVTVGNPVAKPDPKLARLLVIDDHRDTLNLFETFLSYAGFKVTATTSASDALKLSTDGFEAITTDLAMPGMDGVEFIRRMRDARTKPPIPIVAVTGQGAVAACRPEEIGACRVIEKPCELGDLADALRDLIRECSHECSTCPYNPGRAVPPDAA